MAATDFLQVDVFGDRPYAGNALAVFHDAADLSSAQMQTIAREMNLSETTFVTKIEKDEYWARIFTPGAELPFAGHPTLGTAWSLKHLGKLPSGDVVQHSAAGATPVSEKDGLLWFERSGKVDTVAFADQPGALASLAESVGLESRDIGLEARELGRSGRLLPTVSDAGFRMLMLPVRDVATLDRVVPRPDLMSDRIPGGAYVFTAAGAGHVQARGFFPGVGVLEDPATGVAAAALGLFLDARVGPIEVQVAQGAAVGRPSRIWVRAEGGSVTVGGTSALIMEGVLRELP